MNTLCLGCTAIKTEGFSGYGFGPAGPLTNHKPEYFPEKDLIFDLIQVNKYVQKCIPTHMLLFKRQWQIVFDLSLF